MTNLLAANLRLLRKNLVFYLCALATAALVITVCLNQYSYVLSSNAVVSLNKLFAAFPIISGFTTAIFVSCFIGTEYTDGTLRTKLIAGHSRTRVYLSNLLFCMLTGLLLDFVFMAMMFVLGRPLFGPMNNSLYTLTLGLVTGLLATAAGVAAFNFLSTLISNRTAAAIVCLLTAAAFLLIPAILYSKLSEPEMYEGYRLVTETGELMAMDNMPNPLYVPSPRREIYRFIVEFLPGGQGLLLGNADTEHPLRMPLCSLAIILVTTVSGLVHFKKKDIK